MSLTYFTYHNNHITKRHPFSYKQYDFVFYGWTKLQCVCCVLFVCVSLCAVCICEFFVCCICLCMCLSSLCVCVVCVCLCVWLCIFVYVCVCVNECVCMWVVCVSVSLCVFYLCVLYVCDVCVCVLCVSVYLCVLCIFVCVCVVYVSVCVILFIHSSVDGQLRWFYNLAIVNTVMMNMDIQVALQYSVSIFECRIATYSLFIRSLFLSFFVYFSEYRLYTFFAIFIPKYFSLKCYYTNNFFFLFMY